MRINQYLARCGLGSRRTVEALVKEGAVKVNGEVVDALGTQVDPAHDRVEVRGEGVAPPESFDYLILNKPRGYEVTRRGRHHPRRAYDLLPAGVHSSVQAVGRLDRDSTGLLLFTNDGALAHRLMHPRYGCIKTYEVTVEGRPTLADRQRLLSGVELEDGMARALSLRMLPAPGPNRARFAIQIAEGRNRIVRRMAQAIGHPVVALHRTAIGPLRLGGLRDGRCRRLDAPEIERLRASVEFPETPTY